VPTPVAPRPVVAGVLAALSCAAVLTLSACDTSEPAGGSGHEGGHPAEHGGTHPSSEHRPTSPAPPRSSEYDPSNCPTGRVC
jgi:hypothetical protein